MRLFSEPEVHGRSRLSVSAHNLLHERSRTLWEKHDHTSLSFDPFPHIPRKVLCGTVRYVVALFMAAAAFCLRAVLVPMSRAFAVRVAGAVSFRMTNGRIIETD